jgi:hypothetical protein
MCLTITDRKASEDFKKHIEGLPGQRIRVYKSLNTQGNKDNFRLVTPLKYTKVKLDKDGFFHSNIKNTKVEYQTKTEYDYIGQVGNVTRTFAKVQKGIHCYTTRDSSWGKVVVPAWGYAKDFIGKQGNHAVFTKIQFDKKSIENIIRREYKEELIYNLKQFKNQLSNQNSYVRNRKSYIKDSESRIKQYNQKIARETNAIARCKKLIVEGVKKAAAAQKKLVAETKKINNKKINVTPILTKIYSK